MKAIEKTIVRDFNKKWGEADEHQREQFKAMQSLSAARGGDWSSSMQRMLEYLITSEDNGCRSNAMSIFAEYCRMQGYKDAASELFKAFADKEVDWK